jgi:hypothetical protein
LLGDGSPLTDLPWLSFDIPTKTFSGAPSRDILGRFEIKVVATDIPGGQASTNFFIDVVWNSNPAAYHPIFD